jgi:hypothetical protein
MLRYCCVLLVGALALPACASTKTHVELDQPIEDQITPAARRLYTVGEEHYAKGDFHSAILLWRHALLQLPEDQAADEVRHKLIMRMAHTQLLAHEHSQDRTHLTNAARMLNRYAAKHEILFGDAEDARKQRGEVYELLYEVESRLEGPTEPVEEAPAPAASVEPAVEAAAQAPDTHEGETVDGEMRRKVVVSSRNTTDVEDPAIRGRLMSDYSTGWAGLVLSGPETVMWNGPRPLVRLAGTPKVLEAGEGEGAKQAAWNVVRAARPALERCYAHAFARRPVMVSDATVQAIVEPDGNVSRVRIVGGGLIDGLGDACLIETVDSVQVVPDDPQAVARVELPLKFFYQGASYGSMYFNPDEPDQTPQAGLPTIEEFQYSD